MELKKVIEDIKFNLNSENTALVIPQPGQYNPVI